MAYLFNGGFREGWVMSEEGVPIRGQLKIEVKPLAKCTT